MGYAGAAEQYWQSGWRGILPLPAGKKKPPPDGYTGYEGAWPAYPDIQAWADGKPDSSVGLRLPRTVVGIDVDHYGAKRGGHTLTHAEQVWGALPPTWLSTSRVDGVSGIRLFRIPDGVELETVLAFPELGLGDVEIIQYFHRYTVVWPSHHPDTGRQYRWIDPEGNVSARIPRPNDLPELPHGWIAGLGRARQDVTTRADVDAVLAGLDGGLPTPQVQARLAKAVTEITAAGTTRHDVTRDHVLALFRLDEQGETGARRALDMLRIEFVRVVTADGSRSQADAEGEFDRMITGQRGHDLIASTPTVTVEQLVGTPAPSALPMAPRVADAVDALVFADEDMRASAGLAPGTTSWSAIDLGAVLAGDLSPELPTQLFRTDERPLLYPGRVNAVVGAPESGKSWIALHGCAQALKRGGSALYVDFEDTARGVVARLLALGVEPDVLGARLGYISPNEPLGGVARDELFATIDRLRPDLIVLDGVNAALNLLGLDLSSNKDVTAWYQIVLRPLAVTGAAVLLVDHVTKQAEGRGSYAIGAQAKLATIDGTQIGVSVAQPFGRGKVGRLTLSVLKDKHGSVRELTERTGKGQEILATAVIDARSPGRVNISVNPPEKEKSPQETAERKLKFDMVKVSNWLRERPGPHGKADIEEGMTLRKGETMKALNQLIALGHVSFSKERNKHLCAFVSSYAFEEDVSPEELVGE
jgi:hypothetical protein